MDPTTLVSRERAERAVLLFSRLRADGLEMLGALWTQAEGDGQPYLYIITPNVEVEGPLQATSRLVRTLRDFQQGITDPYLLLDSSAMKLIGPSHPLAREILDLYHRNPDDTPTFFYGSPLGFGPIEAAFVYPAKMFSSPQSIPQSA
jgi:hypothetical protein